MSSKNSKKKSGVTDGDRRRGRKRDKEYKAPAPVTNLGDLLKDVKV